MIVRKGTATMTAMGIAMVVAVFVMTLSIAQGFQSTLVASGSPQNAIIMRKGATSENVSAITKAGTAADSRRFRRSRATPTAVRWRRPSSSSSSRCRASPNNEPANVPVRGVGPLAFDVRENLSFVEGRRFTPGTREINVGRAGRRPLRRADARQRREVRRIASGRSSACSRPTMRRSSRRCGATSI